MAFTEAAMSAEALAAAAELEVTGVPSPALKAVISDMLRPDSLPPDWEVRFDAVNRRREYLNKSGEVSYSHPLLSYYRGAAFMETGGYRQLQSNETDQPPAAQEVVDMCAYLGLRVTEDDPYLVEVARLAISAPLPPHWSEGEDDDGNPLFTNQRTGQSQPSHPLDPYFLELIKRRRRELEVRADGVGIRSALAAKRLAAIGVPGIHLPPELQDRVEDAGGGALVMHDLDGEDADEDAEDDPASSRGFGPLVTIEEAEEEGRDEEEEDEGLQQQSAKPSPPPPQQQQQHVERDEEEKKEEEEKVRPLPPPLSAALSSALASPPTAKVKEAEEVKPAAAAKEASKEEPEDEEAAAAAAMEAARRRLREQAEKRRAEAEAQRLREEAAKLAAAEADEEEEEETGKETDKEREKEKEMATEKDDDEEELPTLAAGVSAMSVLREAASMDSGISATAQLLPEPAAAEATAAAEDLDAADVTLAPRPPKIFEDAAAAAEEEERLVLRQGSAAAAAAPLRTTTAHGRRKSDEDDYEDDFESCYEDDFESYADSRRPSREGRRTADTARPGSASRSVIAHPRLMTVAAALTERLPSRTSTLPPHPPPLNETDKEADRSRRNSDDDGEYDHDGGISARLPSPPAAAPPPASSRASSLASRRATSTRGSKRSTVAAAEARDDEAAAEPGGEDGDDEGGEDIVERRGVKRDASGSRSAHFKDEYGSDGGGGSGDGGDDGDDGEDGALEALRKQAAEAAERAAAAAAAFDAKFPPLPVLLDDSGTELHRSRSYTEVETGRLLKQLSAVEAARSAASPFSAVAAGNLDAAAVAAAAGSIYAVSRHPSDRLELLRSRVYGSSGAASAAAAAAAAVAATSTARTPARERIRVAVRARPVPKPGETEAWLIDPASRTVRLKEGAASATHRHISADRVYSFDLVLGPGSSTKQLWGGHVVPLMDAALSGVNATVFAYGQTGSGKTFTMFGGDGRTGDGAIAMSLTYMFKALQALKKLKGGAEEYTVKMSMLELYNEQLRDLLAPGGGPFDRLGRPSGAPLALQDDPRVGVRVSGLEEHVVLDVPAAMTLVERGAISRSVGSTAMNEVSSRSHTIVRLALETREASSHELLNTALVSFVDLAGSERLAKTGSSGARFVEGTNINISLLMLGTVVSKLAEGRLGEFIPYRNSKLTRLLQPCLGGNSKTAIIATINPSLDHVEETFNTLGFATRAMDVVNQVSVNSYVRGSGAVGGAISGAAAAALQKQVATLKAELAALKKEAGAGAGIGISTATLAGADGGGGAIVALMAERLARLEIDKARLLDRLEGITGRPQGDVYDDLPPTPPDLNLPPPRPPGRSGSSGSLIASTTTPLLAVRSIARLVCVGRGGGGAGHSKSLIPRPNEQVPPEEVVVAVRGMRDERDELRRRDAKFRQNVDELNERLAAVEPYRVLAEQVKEVVGMLENILGPSPLVDGDDSDPAAAASSQAARLAENVQAVALMHNELVALQRQVATSEALAAAAARRAEAAEAALQRASAEASEQLSDDDDGGGDGQSRRLQNMVEQLNKQLTAVRREADITKAELAKWRGLASVAPEAGGLGAAGAAAAAAAVAAVAAAAARGGGSNDDPYGAAGAAEDPDDPARQLLHPASLNVGSFAIQRAREAMAQASQLEERCGAAERERDELRDRLQALEEAVAAAGGAGGGRGRMRSMASVKAGGLQPGSVQRQNPHQTAPQPLQQQQQLQQQYQQQLQPLQPPPASGGGDEGDPRSASAGGPMGQQRFEQLRTHVSSLSREVSALTRERDTLLSMVLRMQAPQPNSAMVGSTSVNLPLNAGGGGPASLLYGGMGVGGGYNVSSSVPMPPGMGMDPMRMADGGRGGANAVDPHGLMGMDPAMAAALMRGGGSPVKLKPIRGRVPHHQHHQRHLRDADGYGGGNGRGNNPNSNSNNDLSGRPDFNTRDVPLEAKYRVNRIRDRASRLDAAWTVTPPGFSEIGMGPGHAAARAMGGGGGGGGGGQDQEPVLYGHRDAEMYALKRKLVLAEKARSEAAARAQAEMRNMQFLDLPHLRAGGMGVGGGLGGGAAAVSSSMGLPPQMALAAANRDFKEQARSHVAEMRQMEVVHEENLAATRAEAAAVVQQLMEENNRLKLILVAGAAPGAVAGGDGGGGGTAADFQLRSLGGFGARDGPCGGSGAGIRMSYSESPPRRGPAHLSPLRGGASTSPQRSQSNSVLPVLQMSYGVGPGAGGPRWRPV